MKPLTPEQRDEIWNNFQAMGENKGRGYHPEGFCFYDAGEFYDYLNSITANIAENEKQAILAELIYETLHKHVDSYFDEAGRIKVIYAGERLPMVSDNPNQLDTLVAISDELADKILNANTEEKKCPECGERVNEHKADCPIGVNPNYGREE